MREKNDVIHGAKYRSFAIIRVTDISLCLFTDAAPLYASSKTSLSVMFSSIIELPQRVREAQENILVHSLIIGKNLCRFRKSICCLFICFYVLK